MCKNKLNCHPGTKYDTSKLCTLFDESEEETVTHFFLHYKYFLKCRKTLIEALEIKHIYREQIDDFSKIKDKYLMQMKL
jgi:hypothetical protein